MTVGDFFEKLRRVRSTAAGLVVLSACAWLGACSVDSPPTAPDAGESFSQVQPWSMPVTGEAAHPDLIATPKGDLMLSWVEPAPEGGRQLRIARFDAADSPERGEWSDTMTVAAGADWFLNWADTPHVYVMPNGSIWAHWLRKSSGRGPGDYGIELARSTDDGHTWSPPTLVNLPDLPGDHGFVTFWPQSEDRLGIAWLDSRQKAQAASAEPDQPAADDGSHHAHSGADAAMMLRAAVYDDAGVKLHDWPLDVSTCDCCTTSSAMTSRGPVVVYRGRSAGEIRDTRLVRLEDGVWTAPRDVHVDGWRFAGCPVNGPVVAAEGNTVWVGWYTQADGQPELRVARSDDAGDTFGPPLTVAKGPGFMGQLGIALADGHLLLSWLQQDESGTGQRLMLSRTDRQLQALRSIPVAGLAARGRAGGIPRLAVRDGAARLVWVDVTEGTPSLKGAVVR